MKAIIPLLAALALSGCSLVHTPINVRDLNPPEKVIGRLGKPLGTRVVIEGVWADHAMLADPLLVSRIDGQAVKERLVLPLCNMPAFKRSTQYRLEGYESGAFVSEPPWYAPQMQISFQFLSCFKVYKVLEPPPSETAGQQGKAGQAR